MPPYDLEYELVGITQSLAVSRDGRCSWMRMCVRHRILYLSAEKNRPGSIYQAHGITKIVALFRGREGV